MARFRVCDIEASDPEHISFYENRFVIDGSLGSALKRVAKSTIIRFIGR